ncbi:MAG: endolytic transglycosylase MltG [Bacilli bacterium]|nr:endolytic transglycosylase MltG [Bacilli bacterium]
MKIQHNIYLAVIVLIFSIIIFLSVLFNYGLSRVSNDSTLKKVVIEKGSINDISNTLYKHHLIKSKFAFKLYVKLKNKNNLMAATYNFSENMGTRKVVDILSKGKKATSEIKITFKEGLNMRKIAKIIADETDNTEDDVYNLLDDSDYINKLVDKYWFLTDDIKNDAIYYPLEGYLYPNTYNFLSESSSVEEIFEQMLDETNRQLSSYKDSFSNSSYSIHQIITMASIAELEGITLEERKNIVGVFINRLNGNMNIGSDVTTYYGANVDMGERDLYSEEVSLCNDYNTRCPTFKKLPVSPICNPSIEAIEAAINPNKNNYYYFVADKNKKIYFSRTQKEHTNTINRLKKSDLWFEY